MIRFLLKGILRDTSRSWLPIVIIAIGVSLTVLLSGYIKGVIGDMIDQNARFDTGHVKVMTKAYAENKDQLPNDLALLGLDELKGTLHQEFPTMQWVSRIRFGGLIDVPDENGQTVEQGPVSGLAIELLNSESGEAKRMRIEESLVEGKMPSQPGEALVGYILAEKLGLKPGDEVTFFGSTMNGSMTFKNFVYSGSVKFGAQAMDRGAMLVDLGDAQTMLDMEDGAGELLGYFDGGVYRDSRAMEVAARFEELFGDDEDEYAPVLMMLKEQNNLGDYLEYTDAYTSIFVTVFVMAMSIVLWNTGLLGGLRRYQEFGIRLALGESKGEIYRSLLIEASLIGIIGSIIGTSLGLLGVWYLQVVGIDISSYMQNSTMMMPSILRAKFTGNLLFIGFIPGLFAMLLGTMLSGIGIYRRETATLFKELEV